MSFVLGFGSIETAEREKIRAAALAAAIEGRPVGEAIKDWNDRGEEYDKMPRGEAPQRYTRVYFYDNTLHFHHINREHPFSPDGWAMLQIEEPLNKPTEKKAPL